MWEFGNIIGNGSFNFRIFRIQTVHIDVGVEDLNWPFTRNICKMKIYLNLIIGLEIGKCPSVII